jgi:hypothetical protein
VGGPAGPLNRSLGQTVAYPGLSALPDTVVV